MALLTPDQSNPLGTLPGAMMKGIEMRQMLQAQLDQHREMQQRMQQNQQATSAQDVMNRMTLGQNSRPVNNGMVADDSTPAPVAQQAPAAAPAPAQNSTPANYSPVPPQAPPVAQAAPIAQPSQPIMRKADPSRTVTYTDAQGNKQQRELFTPEEQTARAGVAKNAMEKATGIHIRVPVDPSDPKSPLQDAWIQPNELAEWNKSRAGQQQITMNPDGTLPGTLPISALPSTVRYVDSNAATKARVGIADANNTSKEGIADARDNASEDNARTRSDATRDAAKIRADALDDAARIRNNGQPTPGQKGVQERADERERIRIDEQENGDGKGNPGAFEKRTELGAILRSGVDPNAKDPNAPIGPGQRTLIQNRLKGLTDQLQGLQLRKAKLNGMQPPTPENIGKIPEGQSAVSPDGHTWKKQDGIVYFVN